MKVETKKLIYDLRNLVSLQNITHQEILQKIDSILLCESNESKLSKFNLYDFTKKGKFTKSLHPVYHAVFNIGGYKYATDGRILIKAKATYSEDIEGKGVLKDGTILSDDYRPPRYASILDNIKYMHKDWCKYKPYTINIDKIFEWEKEYKIHKKAYGKTADAFVTLPNDYVAKYTSLLHVAKAMRQYGINQSYIHDEHGHIIYAFCDDCEIALAPTNMRAQDIKVEEWIKVFNL